MEHFNDILNNVNIEISKKYQTSRPPDHKVERIIFEQAREYNNYMKGIKELDGFGTEFKKEFLRTYKVHVLEIIKNTVNIKLEKDTVKELIKTSLHIFSKNIFSVNTGVVIAGYGEEEFFPSLYQYDVEGIVCGRLRYKLGIKEEISPQDSKGKARASIIPFAQKEMVHSFVEGIDPSLRSELEGSLIQIFGNIDVIIEKQFESKGIMNKFSEKDKNIMKNLGVEIYQELIKRLGLYQQDNFISPIVNIVSLLPKEELAALAEALINLTSIKRKMSIDMETVGGPIDVAVITKGDGFIWIKRKHYFSPDLNHSFFERYLGGEENVR